MGEPADDHDYTLAHVILDQAKLIEKLEAENSRLKDQGIDMWTDPYTGENIGERIVKALAAEAKHDA